MEHAVPRRSPSTLPRPSRAPASPSKRRRPYLRPLPNESPFKAQLERIVSSCTFRGAHRSQLFLRYILDHSVGHPNEALKEYSIAVDVFDRDISYDPAVNNTVRVEAGRLRTRLLEYYAGEGRADPLVFEVPKGSYRVLIHPRDPVATPSPAKTPQRPASAPHLWAVPLAFVLGAFFGYRASH